LPTGSGRKPPPVPKKAEETPVQELARHFERCLEMAGGALPKDRVVFAAMDAVEKFCKDNNLTVDAEFAAKKARTGEGAVTKAQRVAALKEELQNGLVRLHHNQVPQFAGIVRGAQRVIAGGNFTGSLANFALDELTDVMASVSSGGTSLRMRYNSILACVLKAEIATKDEVALQVGYVSSMLTSIIELAIVNEFADPSGTVSWVNLTMKLGKMMRGEAMED